MTNQVDSSFVFVAGDSPVGSEQPPPSFGFQIESNVARAIGLPTNRVKIGPSATYKPLTVLVSRDGRVTLSNATVRQNSDLTLDAAISTGKRDIAEGRARSFRTEVDLAAALGL